MAKIALSMKPTGWFQIAWSKEIGVGEVKPLKYFGQDLVAFRTQSGKLHVFDAYCEHLGAHLGYGGTVRDEVLVCPFHGWEWNGEGRNVCIPYQDRPNKARRIRTWPVAERNECAFIWHDVAGREPLFEVPDVFTGFDDGLTAGDFYPGYPVGTLIREKLELHPQYVIENGVDFAHFKFVHRAAEVPRFTRQEFDDWVFHVAFDMTFRPSRKSAVQGAGTEIQGGAEAMNVGISLGLSRAWGADNMRSLVSVTPVDEDTSDIRSTSWFQRLPDDDSPELPEKLYRRLSIANHQFLADVAIWEHQRYSEPPGLATAEAKGFRAVRRWATRFYPDEDTNRLLRLQDAGTEAPEDSYPEDEPVPVDRTTGTPG